MGADPAVSPLSIERCTGLYPGIRPLAFRVMQDVFSHTGRAINIVQAARDSAAQLACYAKGRTCTDGVWTVTDKGSIVTNARPGMSFHEYGLAFDIAWAGSDPYLKALPASERENLWNTYGAFVRAHGLRWGGDSIHLVNGVEDIPHAEMTWGLTIQDCLELTSQGGIAAVWRYLDAHRGVAIGDGWDLA